MNRVNIARRPSYSQAMSRLLLSLLACAALLPSTLRSAPNSDRLVILISVDGFAHYYFDDPKAQIPTIRKLAAAGARAKRMECSYPTVTWTNHTTLVTGVTPGKHGVIGNNYFDRTQLKSIALIPDPIFDKDEVVKAPTIYDVAKAAGLKTAGVIWPCSRNAKTLDWTVPDVFEQELFEKYGTPSLLADARELGIPIEKQMEWCKLGNAGKPQRDYLYSQLACHIIKKHKPNVLLLHLVTVDSLEHATGRNSPEAYWALNDSDNRVRDLVEAVEAAGLKDKTTFVVTADHGFISYTKNINANALLRREGLIKSLGTKLSPGSRAYALGQGGGCFIYILDQANKAEIAASLKAKYAQVEGVSAVIDDPKQVGHVSAIEDAREPDLFLSAKDGYSFSDSLAETNDITDAGGTKGAHGYLATEPQMGGAFIISGHGVKPGTTIDAMSNLDVAPTMANLLGLEMKNVDGRVLDEVLVK